MDNQQKVWDNIAPSWATYRTQPQEEVREFLGTIQKGKLLDLGCGSGRNFPTNPKVEVYAIDISPEMLKLAIQNAKQHEVNLKESKVSKANIIPYQGNTFNAVLCNAVLHCIPSKEEQRQTLKEIVRVLKSQGKAFISVWSKTNRKLKNKPKECIVNWKINENNHQERYTYLYDKEELEEEVKEAGLAIESSEERNGNIIIRGHKL